MGSILDCNIKVMDLLNRAKALVEDMAALPARKQPAVVPIRTSERFNSRALR